MVGNFRLNPRATEELNCDCSVSANYFETQVPETVRGGLSHPEAAQQVPHHPLHDDDEHRHTGGELHQGHRIPQGNPRAPQDGAGGSGAFPLQVHRSSQGQLEDQSEPHVPQHKGRQTGTAGIPASPELNLSFGRALDFIGICTLDERLTSKLESESFLFSGLCQFCFCFGSVFIFYIPLDYSHRQCIELTHAFVIIIIITITSSFYRLASFLRSATF